MPKRWFKGIQRTTAVLSLFGTIIQQALTSRRNQLIEFLWKPVGWLLCVACFYSEVFPNRLFNTTLTTLHLRFVISFWILLTLRTF